MIEVPHRALSVIQPWTWAIAEGFKPLENRDWPPPAGATDHVIALHASKGYDNEALLSFAEVGGDVERAWLAIDHTSVEQPSTLARGAFVGTVKVRGFVNRSGAMSLPRSTFVWFCGEYGWLLENPVPLLKAVPAKGKLGLWYLDVVQRAALGAQLEADRNSRLKGTP